MVVPRERFSFAEASLRSLLEHTPGPRPIVYVDAGSPPPVRRAIESLGAAHGLRILRSEGFLSPNQARNRGLAAAVGEYVVFIDNDVLVIEGWLDRLVCCAEETGADIVGPLYLHGPPTGGLIHMAAGVAHVEERAGRRLLREAHCHPGERVADLAASLRRQACELVEFHCVLVRRSLFERVGALDEGLLSLHEHIDLCLLAREAGGAVWFEPDARVAYVPPPPFGPGDRSYYLLRWSREWNRVSERRFVEKWRLDGGTRASFEWAECHRKRALGALLGRLGAHLGAPHDNWLANGCDRLLEWTVTRRAAQRWARA